MNLASIFSLQSAVNFVFGVAGALTVYVLQRQLDELWPRRRYLLGKAWHIGFLASSLGLPVAVAAHLLAGEGPPSRFDVVVALAGSFLAATNWAAWITWPIIKHVRTITASELDALDIARREPQPLQQPRKGNS